MRRFGIRYRRALGVTVPEIRRVARRIGVNHTLAQELWDLGIRETMLLASIVADHRLVTESQMERWVMDFDNWEICDQVCGNLFVHTDHVYRKIFEFSARSEEFVKRAGFAMIAELAVHDKSLHDEWWENIFPIFLRESWDHRHMVKKAMSWALRQIGKRNVYLRERAMKVAGELRAMNSKSSVFIASQTIRELNSSAVKKRLKIIS